MAKRKNITKKTSVASLETEQSSRPAKRVHFADELLVAAASEPEPAPKMPPGTEQTVPPMSEPALTHLAKTRRSKKKVSIEDLATPVSAGSSAVEQSVVLNNKALHHLASPANSRGTRAVYTVSNETAIDSYPSPTESVASISSAEGQSEATRKKNKKKKKRKPKSFSVNNCDADPTVQQSLDQDKLKKETSTSSLSNATAIDASKAAMILAFVGKRQEDRLAQFLAASRTHGVSDLRTKTSAVKLSSATKARIAEVVASDQRKKFLEETAENVASATRATIEQINKTSPQPAKVTLREVTKANQSASPPKESPSQNVVPWAQMSDEKVKATIRRDSKLDPDVWNKVAGKDDGVSVPRKFEAASVNSGAAQREEFEADGPEYVPVKHNSPIDPFPIPRFDFYQTATSVVISIYLKNLRQDEVITTLKSSKLVVSINTEQIPFSLAFTLPHLVNEETCRTSVSSMKVEISLNKSETRNWATLGIPKVEPLELAYFTPPESSVAAEGITEGLESLCISFQLTNSQTWNGDKKDSGTFTDSIVRDTMTSSNITTDSQMDEFTAITDDNEDELSEAQLAAPAPCVFTDNSDDESDLDHQRFRSSLVYHRLLPERTHTSSGQMDVDCAYEDGSSAETPMSGKPSGLIRRAAGSRSVLSLSEEAGVDTAISTPTSTYSAYDYRDLAGVANAKMEALRHMLVLSRPLSPVFDEDELEISTPDYDDEGNWVDALEGDEDGQRTESHIVPQMISAGVRKDSGYDEPGMITKRLSLTGLANVGNTCFLNCIVQCLNSFDSFVGYFLDESFANDINLYNPLSPSKGHIVTSFARLLDGLHNGGPSCRLGPSGPYVYPKEFLSVLARYAPQYEAYQQHDAQEFLQFLLDTIHEEVNKIVKKPYIELPDFDDSEDPNCVGLEFWKAHKARNDSIVVDEFQGMYRSKMTCRECGKTSVKCDPYMSLTVDLPVLPIELPFILVTKHLQKVTYQFNMRPESTLRDLYDEIARYLGIPSNCLQAAWVSRSLIHEVFIPQTPIACVLNDQQNLCIYEVEPNSSLFRLYHRKRSERQRFPSRYRQTYNERSSGYGSDEEFEDYETLGFPFFLSIPEGTSLESFAYRNIVERLVEESVIHPPFDEPLQRLPDQLFSIKVLQAGEELAPGRNGHEYSMLSQTGSVKLRWDNDCWNDYFNETFDLKVEEITSDRHGIGYSVSLEDCLRQHLQEEASVEWYCPRCKKHTVGSKKLDLWSIPQGGLIIHLKRFVQYGQTPYWVKTDGKVIFPIAPGTLDMSNFVVSCDGFASYPKFELVGVADHWGGLTSGHYTAMCKRGGDWYYFDDEKVVKAGEEYLKASTGSAYVLFYKPCV